MPQQLPTKEASLFRQLVKFYESKQHKKGIKNADQILKKHPNHGETQAMKALILNSQGRGEEAFALGKLALQNDMKSHVCWHVYGLLWRSVKNYEEAVKAYKFALRIEPDSQNILRDLALLQCQIRDFEGYIESRKKILNARSSLRQNWTGLAIAHHLDGDYKEAIHVLETYEETLKQPPAKSDLEHSEAALYKNTIIAESGDTERALIHLEEIMKSNLDKTAVLELKAKYLLQLDRKEEAAKTYRALLDRNSDYRAYYDGLENAMGLDKSDEASVEKLTNLYATYASKNERSDAPRRIPLDFLKGDAFKTAADQYLRQKLNKGVPSTFPNIKSLYVDPEKKATIEELVLGYASEKAAMNGSAEGKTSSSNRFENAVLSFLAQHYTYAQSQDLDRAMEYVERLLEKDPKSVDYNQIKARIWKSYGDTQKAADTINHARELDVKDRYINTKCAKYQLRNNENDKALETMSKFTRNEAVGGPLGDLHDMQCMWFLLEDGEAYLRRGKIALALKRFTAVAEIFEVWQEDQFDFHSFSLRKGQIRAYIDMVRWEDHLRDHPFFTRAALLTVKLYLRLYDDPNIAKGGNAELDKLDPLERKKVLKKLQKEQEKVKKAEADRKAAAQAKATPKADDEQKKEDTDPNGEKLLQTKEPLEVALKSLTPLLELSPRNIDGQDLGFQVYLRRSKPLLALKCFLAAKELDPDHPSVHKNAILFRQYLNTLKEPLARPVTEAITESFTSPSANADTAALKATNDEFIKKYSTSPSHLQAAYDVRHHLDAASKCQNETDLQTLLELDNTTTEQAAAGTELLEAWKSDAKVVDAYREAAAKKWPHATRFTKK